MSLTSILTIFILMQLFQQECEGATVTNNEPTYYVEEGETASFPWRYTLGSGETLRRITWTKTSVNSAPIILEIESGVPYIYPAYVGRASTTWTSSNGEASLQLTGVTSADVGVYKCTLNVIGGDAVEPTAQLILAVPASITIPPPSTTRVKLSESVTINVTADGTPDTFSYTWKEGTRVIDPGTEDRYSESNGVLTITNVPRSLHDTTYTCEVTNNVGTPDMASTVLSVEYAPEVSAPSEETLTEGGTLTIECTVSARPAASVEWKKQGSTTPVSSTAQLAIPNVQRTAAGTYVCTARNTFHDGSTGTGTANIVVTVQYKPSQPTVEITPNPVVEDQTVTLTCSSASSAPAPTSYTWTRDGQSVSHSGGTLTFNNVQRGQAGQYRCTANNVVGTSDESGPVGLVVNYKPSQPTVEITPNPVVENQTVTLTCSSASSAPAPTSYSWTRDGQSVSYSGGTLTITNVQRGQAGQYRCTATNVVGTSDESGPVGLVVNYEPEGTTVTPRPAVQKEGDPLTLTCTADGNPDPTFTWSKDPGPIPAGIANNDTIQITILHRNDAATYTCTVDNGIGQPDSATGTVDVLYLDTPTLNQTSPLTVLEGDSVSAMCSAAANPPAGYNWTKQNSSDEWNSNVLNSSNQWNNDILTLSQANRSDAGTYICKASNVIKGTTETKNVTLEIIVNYPPELTVTATPNPVNETQSVSLTCTADSNPDVINITWMFVDTGEILLQQITGNRLTYTNSSVSHESAGVYRCTAGNGVAGSPVSKDVTLNVNSVPIFNHTRDRYAVGRSQPVTLECSAFAYPPQIVYTWMKGGYDITGNATSQDRVSTLYLASVQMDDYGDYTCTASNEHGQRATIIQLAAETQPEPSTNLAYTKKTGLGLVTMTWTAEFNGGLETTHTVQYRLDGTTDWVSGPSVVEVVSQNRPEFTQTVEISEKGRYEIRIRTQNSQGAVGSNVIQVLVEENQTLYGTLAITSVEYSEGICDGGLSNRIVTQLDSIFESYKGYEEAHVTACRPGSVLADFEATVANSESAAAQDTYIENLADGQLGEFTVASENSRINDINPASGENITTTTIIIIAVVCGVAVAVIVIVGCICLCRNSDKKGKEGIITPDDRPASMVGLTNVALDQSTEIRPYGEGVQMSSMNIYNDAQSEPDDRIGAVAVATAVPLDPNVQYSTVNKNVQIPTGNPYDDVHFERDENMGAVDGEAAGPVNPALQYATVNKNIQIPTGNPYDDVSFERDEKTGSVAGETTGPLDPTAQYATVNKKKDNVTTNPNTVYAQVNKDKKKKDKEKPTLVVDPSSEYATIDKSKKKKKEMPPPPEDPSAQYSEVKKGKKDKKASPVPEVIYTEVKKEKKDKKDKKKPAAPKKPDVKNAQEAKKNPQGLIYAELSDFQLKPPPKKPTKAVPPKPRYEDAPTEYAAINWNASRRRAQEQSQGGSDSDVETI